MQSKDNSSPMDIENQDEGHEHARSHPLDRLMFGDARPPKRRKQKEEAAILSQVNLESLMENIDTLMYTAQELKPIYNKIRPYINQFFKK
ncbi:hypothetical protein J7E71_10555 [Mesobacillus foraminis]|uniref:hypothetical protein n=1 Tax=Mesobacillus foraminis TaxID=279826 RepID=UPI001BE6C7F2|nr:hypothetical protein [Mesobacillus foraminis]MBT2756394.1 hypothetical protein [Mesobacillus foraminis]